MMITAEQRQKYYKGTNHHATYTYYRCTKKHKVIKCHQPYIREEDLNKQLSNMIQKVSLKKDWLGPMKDWINLAANAAKIVNSADLFSKKKLAGEIFGSDLILENKKARADAQNLWAALAAPRNCLTVELLL